MTRILQNFLVRMIEQDTEVNDLEIEYLCGMDFGAVGKRDQSSSTLTLMNAVNVLNIYTLHRYCKQLKYTYSKL